MEKEIVESIIGVDIKFITNKGEYKTIRMTDFKDLKDSWISIKNDVEVNSLYALRKYITDIHIESRGYNFEVGGMGGWIPCSVRTPDITDDNGYSDTVLTIVQWWDDDLEYDIGWYHEKYGWNRNSMRSKVIAWQPLPPKYNPDQTRI